MKVKKYFSRSEIWLWVSSLTLIIVTFFAFRQSGYLSLIASLIGVTAILFCAKGNPIGQGLMIIFGLLYGIISYGFSYYGEMITYVGMTVPMAIFVLFTWLKNPYKESRAQVKIASVKRADIYVMLSLCALVTAAFYFILKLFGTANLLPSTISVTTSFAAVFLSYKRSPYFALAYAINDLVLIILWILAAFKDISYLSVIVCFVVFLINDLYGFFNWRRMEKRQRLEETKGKQN